LIELKHKLLPDCDALRQAAQELLHEFKQVALDTGYEVTEVPPGGLEIALPDQPFSANILTVGEQRKIKVASGVDTSRNVRNPGLREALQVGPEPSWHRKPIGFRSTRIRTLDRTLITLPNGKLAEMRIEFFRWGQSRPGARDRDGRRQASLSSRNNSDVHSCVDGTTRRSVLSGGGRIVLHASSTSLVAAA
jgi:hypothetical protein